jgi:hypothetical protein
MYGNAPARSNTAWVASLGVVCAVACVAMAFAAPPTGGSLRPVRFKRIQVEALKIPDAEGSPMTFDGEPCWSRGRRVNVRAGPSTRKAKVTFVTDGTPMRCLDKEKRWYQVRLANRREGWIRGDLLIHTPPKAYKTLASNARNQGSSGNALGALQTWSGAVEIGQEVSGAYEEFPTALARAALKRASDHAMGQPLTRRASRRNPIAAMLPCKDGRPTREAVYTMYRALEITGLEDPSPTFLVTSPEREGPWAALHLQRAEVLGRGGRLEVTDSAAGCELRMVMTSTWQESLDTWTRAATVEGAMEGRFVELAD